jgi:sodium pump decarboxylase gamma subunit
MIQQGMLLMIAGMSTVFLFLVIMVFLMKAAGAFFKMDEARYLQIASESENKRKRGNNMEPIVAAIAVALHCFESEE